MDYQLIADAVDRGLTPPMPASGEAKPGQTLVRHGKDYDCVHMLRTPLVMV
jgi:hypothetical protein